MTTLVGCDEHNTHLSSLLFPSLTPDDYSTSFSPFPWPPIKTTRTPLFSPHQALLSALHSDYATLFLEFGAPTAELAAELAALFGSMQHVSFSSATTLPRCSLLRQIANLMLSSLESCYHHPSCCQLQLGSHVVAFTRGVRDPSRSRGDERLPSKNEASSGGFSGVVQAPGDHGRTYETQADTCQAS